MNRTDPTRDEHSVAHAFYVRALEVIGNAGVPFLVGGAYALARYTGIERFTKDFDIFLKAADRDRAIDALRRAGYRSEVSFEHWLAKAYDGEYFLDIIYSAGNGVAAVDPQWFAHAVEGEVLGLRVRLVPAEEMIWSKAFIMERERFDGADVLHVLRAMAERLDWDRLLRRFDRNWRVLFAHLVLFGFVYPAERARIPRRVIDNLLARLDAERRVRPPSDRVCRGTLLSREQYLPDIHEWGYDDARLRPRGAMNHEEIHRWTEAIAEK